MCLFFALVLLPPTRAYCQDQIAPEASEKEEEKVEVVVVPNSYYFYTPVTEPLPRKFKKATLPLRLAISHDKKGNPKTAKKYYREAIQKLDKFISSTTRGLKPDALLMKGFAYEKLSQKDKALKAYKKSVNTKAKNPQALYRHALLLTEKKEYTTALGELREVMFQDATSTSDAYYLIAKCYEGLEKKGEAAKALKKSLAANPNFIPARKRMIELRAELLETVFDGEKKRKLKKLMISDLNLLLAVSPNDKQAQFHLAKLLAETSDPFLDAENLSRAESYAKALAEDTEYKDASTVRLLFDTQLRRNLVEDAKATVTKGLRHSPSSQELIEASMQLEIIYSAQLAKEEQKEAESNEEDEEEEN